MRVNKPLLAGFSLACFFSGFFLAACGGGQGTSGQGTLVTSISDSFTEEYKAVYVTIGRVDVHLGGDEDEDGRWQTVAKPGGTYNLLELVNGVRERLGVATLEASTYTQMRLVIGTEPYDDPDLPGPQHPFANYVVDSDDDEIHELKVPSGPETGLKIQGGFEILDGGTTELILDFDAMRSVVKAGSSGDYLLKPTVSVLDITEGAIVSGNVSDGTDPLEGARVMAQTADSTAPDPRDEVIIKAGTVSSPLGSYAMFLLPGEYNLVANREGYLPACVPVDLAAQDNVPVDFVLGQAVAGTGTISGMVSIAAAGSDQYATIDFRQEIPCGGTDRPVTVRSINVADGYPYSVVLPPGNYRAVGWTYGEAATVLDVAVTSGAETLGVNFSF